jgi:ectoine hydroxylase-related dioxygenase (phytanoyl-CoA dioxygenase family)
VNVSVRDEHIDAFRRDGFVVLPDLLDPAERERYGAAVDAAVTRRTREDRRSLAEKSLYEQSFQQCINLWEDFEDVRALTFHSRLAESAALLLGVRALRVWHDQALYKEAGGRGTDPHQDQPYWPLHETDAITAWIPFDGSTRENGCMGYLPGSHTSGLRRFANIFTSTGYDLEALPQTRGRETVWVEVPAGAVAFHHGLTVHRALPNTSPRTRRVHTVIYFADGTTRVSREHPHPAVDRAGIAPGAVVASDVTPIAWPRPAGDLPPTPPRPDPLLRGWPGWPADETATPEARRPEKDGAGRGA